jgi:hypothetical protein
MLERIKKKKNIIIIINDQNHQFKKLRTMKCVSKFFPKFDIENNRSCFSFFSNFSLEMNFNFHCFRDCLAFFFPHQI